MPLYITYSPLPNVYPGIYETPGGAVLLAAHMDLEVFTLDRVRIVLDFLSSGIMDCTCVLLTFKNSVPRMRYVASVVWHLSLTLMNSFNKTEASISRCRLCFLRTTIFLRLNYLILQHYHYVTPN